jgi:hypothetical protein
MTTSLGPAHLNPQQAKAEIELGLAGGKLIVLVGNCSITYRGRAASKISSGDRLVIIKSDGTFLVHQSHRMTAINYQGPGSATLCTILDSGGLCVASERARPLRERIEVIFHRLEFVQSFAIHDDESITVLGTERELSDLLMDDLSRIEPGLVPLQQESGLAKGMIDILAEDKQGNLVVVELKRRTAHLDAASQLIRYVQELAKRKNRRVRGILCSPAISPNAKAFLEKEGMEWRKLDYAVGEETSITGLARRQKSLGEY